MNRRSALTLALSGALLTATGCTSPATATSGFKPLFNGKDVNDWLASGGQANWRVQDGMLIADTLKDPKAPSYLVTKESYGNFQIRAEFFVDTNTNSGIFIRCEQPDLISAKTGYEVNIWDTRPEQIYGTGAIVDVAKVSPMPLAGGKWNTFEITAKGSQMTVVLNGVQSSAGSDTAHASGRIALQFGGGGVVKFRNVQIKTLS